TIKDHKRIIFNGNGYDDSWIREATKERGLLNYRTTPDCMPHLLDKKNTDMLIAHGVFTMRELQSRCEIMLENYCKSVIIEANTMVDMARTQIAPAVSAYAADLAEAAGAKKSLIPELMCSYETCLVKRLSLLTDQIQIRTEELAEALVQLQEEDIIKESEQIRDIILPKMCSLRIPCDEAETITAREYWPYPTYGDLLFGVK
ncbi:MAG: glutamine synthetase type III, partial [Eubacterium sp.]|nr:glutamine synthetase type III [Eubacterium sp.]